MRFNVEISEEIRKAAPGFKMIQVEGKIKNRETSAALIAELDSALKDIQEKYEMAEINKIPEIAATRQAYKALGKEPNRYRPSAEALHRRAVKGTGLYHINEMVDLINLLSMWSGHSIGAFDADKIQGDTLRLGRGAENEDFEGIGRGPLNIDGLPVYRDAAGGIGTPTSDNERTKITMDTTNLLLTINLYGEGPVWNADKMISTAITLLEKYVSAEEISYCIRE